MADVDWTDEAVEQLDLIVAYVRQFNAVAAERIASELFALGESLAYSPHRGRLAPHGTRELVSVQPYILRYDVDQDGTRVSIVSVRHSARLPLD